MPMQPKAPSEKVWGIDPELWRATHDPSIAEHAAGRFFLSWNGGLVRIAFGQNGPPLDEKGTLDTPRFHLTVSMAPAMAIELRNTLDRMIAQAGGASTTPTSPSSTVQSAPTGNGAGQGKPKEE